MIQNPGFVTVPLLISEPSLLMSSTAVYWMLVMIKAHFQVLLRSPLGVIRGLQTTWGTLGERERCDHSRWLIKSRAIYHLNVSTVETRRGPRPRQSILQLLAGSRILYSTLVVAIGRTSRHMEGREMCHNTKNMVGLRRYELQVSYNPPLETLRMCLALSWGRFPDPPNREHDEEHANRKIAQRLWPFG